MIIKYLKLRNFRNYINEEIYFQKGIHFISGKNGQGKTNLLESIYYLSCTKSHRTNNNIDLINKEKNIFILEGKIEKKDKNISMKCVVNKEGKNLYLHKQPINKVSEFIGVLNAVMFCPDDLNLFNATPKERRKFIDLELGKISKSYTNTLNTYYKLLKERNMYLKNEKIDKNFIKILDDQMIDNQIQIMYQRKHFVDKIIDKSSKFYQLLSKDNTNISYEYKSFVHYDSKEIMKEQMKNKYDSNLDKDILYKQTMFGIHKDDFVFKMNEFDVVSYASQGQKRSIILSLKLGIVESIYELIGSYPILLLDDVFSELDEYRRNMLLELLDENIQIFISSTDKIKIKNKKINYYEVENSCIKKCKED